MKEENFSEIEKISLKIKENEIKNIYLNFTDFDGNMCSKLVGVKELINNTHVSWNNGISINGKLIKNFEDAKNADWLVVLPIAKTFRIIPFLDDDDKSAMIMCKIKDFPLDTRYLLENAVYDVKKEINAEPIIGSELIYEFRNSKQNYYYSLPTNKSTKFKDKLQISRWFLNSLAYQNNENIKFSNIENKNISTCPLHISLWDENRKNNLFFDEDDELELSKLAKNFINGILYFHKYIYAICKVTTNIKKSKRKWYKMQYFYKWFINYRKYCKRIKKLKYK